MQYFAPLFCNRYFDVSGVGGDLAFTAGRCLGNVDVPGIGADKEYFFASKRARNVSGVGDDFYFRGIEAVEFNVSGTYLNRKFSRKGRVIQNEIAGGAV